jgi:cytochrome c biogenesis protein CcmG, thiol:disulfide interchange protein DsbE
MSPFSSQRASTQRASTRRPFLVRALALLAVAAVVCLAAAPAGAGGELDEQRSPKVTVTGTKLKASGDIGTPDDPAIGKVAPELTGLSLAGKATTFGDDGTPRILVFLSHSCPHCQAEVPRIVKLAKAGKLDGVEIQTVATNTTKQLPNWPPSKWLKREGWPYKPVLADDDQLRAFFAYGGEAFPYFVFVGADGKVAGRVSGEIEPASLATAAENLVAGQSLFE